MSSMLEQAILDAKELKEAAIKNAQQSLIEKYSNEFEGEIEKLLEQAAPPVDPMAAAPVPPMGAPMPGMPGMVTPGSSPVDAEKAKSDSDSKSDIFSKLQYAYTDGEVIGNKVHTTGLVEVDLDSLSEFSFEQNKKDTEQMALQELKALSRKSKLNEELEEEMNDDDGFDDDSDSFPYDDESEDMDDEDMDDEDEDFEDDEDEDYDDLDDKDIDLDDEDYEDEESEEDIDFEDEEEDMDDLDMDDEDLDVDIEDEDLYMSSEDPNRFEIDYETDQDDADYDPDADVEDFDDEESEEDEEDDEEDSEEDEEEDYEDEEEDEEDEMDELEESDKHSSSVDSILQKIENLESSMKKKNIKDSQIKARLADIVNAVKKLNPSEKKELQEAIKLDYRRSGPRSPWNGMFREEGEHDVMLAELQAQIAELEQYVEELQESNKKLKDGLKDSLRLNESLNDRVAKYEEKLLESRFLNYKLLYTNKALTDGSLNERQKNKIAESISNAKTAEEVKLLYETLKSTMRDGTSNSSPKSLSEAVERRSSSLLLRASRAEAPKQNDYAERMKKLAGLT